MRETLEDPRKNLMDPLSELVRLTGLQASLDLRCQFAEGVAVDHERAPERQILFHLVLSGHCCIDTPGHPPMEMGPGDFLALPHGQPHRVRSRGEPGTTPPGFVVDASAGLPLRRSETGAIDLDLLCGRFAYHSSAVDALFAGLPEMLRVSLADAAPEADLRGIVAHIRSEVEAGNPGAGAIVAALSTVLFTLALRASSQRDTTAPGLLRLIGDRRLARVTRAMFDDPGQAWPVEQLAEAAAMSRAAFARHFKAVAAMTPGDFLLQVRMSRAAELLERTRRAPADIGADVGYQSEAAFAKAFRRVMGASPAAFRKKRGAAGHG